MISSDTNISGKGILERLLRIRMTLRNVVYITYALPSERLQPIIPEILKPATVGNDIAFISVVTFRSTNVRLSAVPIFKFDYSQLNIRTYVIDPVSGRQGVYFLKSGISSRFISLIVKRLNVPWEQIEITTNLNNAGKNRVFSAWGKWEGAFYLEVEKNPNPDELTDFFRDKKSATDFLIRPLIGFAGDKDKLTRLTIQHPEVNPEGWILNKLDCPLLKNILSPEELMKPHSVFYLPESDFSIFLRMKRINKEGK